MRSIFAAIVILTISSSFAQDNAMKVGFEAGLNRQGPTMMPTVDVSNSVVDLKGGIGINGEFKSIVVVDIEIKDYFYQSKDRKFKIIAGYNPLDYKSSGISATTEALLKAKLGVEYDKTKIKYGIAPFGNFVDRTTNVSRKTNFHNLEIEQVLSSSTQFYAKIKYGIISPQAWEIAAPGRFLASRTELSHQFKSGVTILAFYEMEDFNYHSIDSSVSNVPREINTKNSLSTLGLGVKLNLNGSRGGSQ